MAFLGRRGKRLSAFAEYFFGGGADHCGDCVLRGRACARGLPGEDGTLCPRYENDPQTMEGQTALRVAISPGIWRRGGMAGVMCGIDWAAARHLAEGLGEGLPWPLMARALAWFEGGALKGEAKRHKDKEERRER